MSLPPVFTFNFTYTLPTNPTDLTPIRSFADIQFIGTSVFGNTIYDAWCVDRNAPIDATYDGAGHYIATYKTSIYSINEMPFPVGAFPNIQNWGNLDEVDWLIRQNFSASGYTFGEVQAAIWNLLGDDWTTSTSIGTPDPAKVNTLIGLASTHDGFAPVIDITDADPTNDDISVLLATFRDVNNNNVYDAGDVKQQPLIIQVKSAALGDRVWHDIDADGIQDAGEAGISGVLVHLVRDSNNDGDFLDAGEILQTTNTDGSGNYVFKGLAPGADYQVQFFMPAGYEATSPRQAAGGTAANNSDGLVSDVVVLAAGEYNPTIDSGFYKFVSVGNYVWNDTDSDGIQDGAETGIGGVNLTLTGTTGSGQAVLLTTTTAANGSYLFANLAPGTYQVTVDASNFLAGGALDGYIASPIGQGVDPALDSNASPTGTTPVFLPSGTDDLTLDFGYTRPTASIGDRVWEDKDADGQQDAGENGIPGATVRLYTCVNNAPGVFVAQTVTDANGNYSFNNLQPGDYIVEFTTPAGYTQTLANVGADATDSDNVGGLSGCYTLSPGENENTVDAGFYRPAAIGNQVWLDTNANGQQDDGEPGVSGVTVELYACVNDLPSGPVLATDITDVNGIYNFTGLTPGDYIVKFITPAGYTLTTANVGADATDSDAGVGGLTGCYNLESGETDNTADAGLIPPTTLIDIEKYTNSQDADSPTGPVITVGDIATFTYEIKNPGSEPLTNIVVTDNAGTPGIPGDDFNPAPVLAGFVQTIIGLGTIRFPSLSGSQANGLGFDLSISGPASFDENDIQSVSWTLDPVTFQITSLNLVLQHDTNQFGVDYPSSRVDLTLTSSGIGQVQGSGGDVSYFLDGSGNPVGIGGAYLIPPTAVMPAGTGFNAGDIDSDNLLDVNETWLYQGSRIVTAGQYTNDAEVNGSGVFSGTPVQDTDPSNHLGLLPAALGNYVWLDKDADGLQDAGETGIDGVKVRLLKDTDNNGTPDTVVLTQFTGDDPSTPGTQQGFYKFSGLTPGVAYQVQFVNPDTVGPDAYSFSPQDQGVNDTIDSDANVITGQSQTVVLTPGQYNDTVDAGLYRKGSIHVFGFLDTDGDGILDVTEGAFPNDPGKTIQLINQAGVVVQTKVTVNGEVSFDGLAPGIYSVREDLIPAGYALTTPQQVTVTIQSGEEYVYMQGAADLPDGDQRTEVINTNLVFGNTQLASLGDRLWVDTNGDGQQNDGATGISGQTITLIGGGADGLINGIGDTSTNTITGADGFYQFTGLTPGVEYQVQFSKPTGTAYTTQDVGSDITDSDANVATGLSQIVILASGENNPTIDAGVVSNAGIDIEKYVRARYTVECSKGDEGLSCDHWKKHESDDESSSCSWKDTGYKPEDNCKDVFGVEIPGYKTLHDALCSTGDGDIGMMREAVAGLLNACKPSVDYAYTKEQVISMTQQACSSGNYEPTKYALKSCNDLGAKIDNPTGSKVCDVEENRYTSNSSECEGFASSHWKDHAYDDDSSCFSWKDTGYKTTDSCEAIFGFKVSGCETLYDALCSTGDGATGMMREAVAGLLNASKSSYHYSYSKDEVIDKTRDGHSKGDYDSTCREFKEHNSGGYEPPTTQPCVIETPNYDADTAPGIYIPQGGEAIFTYVVKNTGNVALGNVTLTDDRLTSITFVGGDTDHDGLLDVGETWTYTAKETATCGLHTNIGTVVGTDSMTGANVTDSDAANYTVVCAKQSIGDRVWGDCDGDGVQDAGEAGIAGVTVKLLNSAGTAIASTTTDANGNYLFTDLAVGTYAIQVVAPTGYAFTTKDQGGDDSKDSDVDPLTGKTILTSLETGEHDLSWDAGLIAAKVCFDYNFAGSSSSDGSDGNTRSYTVNGVTVNASAWSRASGTTWAKAWLGSYSGGLGVTDSSESGSGNTHTIDNYGRQNFVVFQFSQNVVVDKAYLGYVYNDSDMQVWIGSSAMPITSMSNSVLTGMGFTEFNSGGSSTRWADLNAGEVQGNVLIVAAKPGDTNDYFKLEKLAVCTTAVCEPPPPPPTPKASIGNLVWEDKNANGVQDAGEPGIAGVTVKLLDAGGTVLSTMTTDANGNYLFSNLAAGDYKVQVVTPTGYSVSPKDAGGNDAADSDIDPATGQTIVTTLDAGENDMTWDAGFYKPASALPASIGNFVWCDTDGDGIQDAGESGIAGVTVKLLNGSGTLLASTATDANGNYLFSNLTAGDYKVQVVTPTGYGVSPKDAGGNDSTDSDIDPSTGQTIVTTLVAGENDMTWDAGLYKKPSGGTICDRVWYDSDKDGIQDSGESGCAGIKVCLQDSSGKTIKTCTTDSKGNYAFNDVNAGSYRLYFDKSGTSYSYKSWSTKDVSSNRYDTTDSDVNSSGYTSYFSVKDGDNQSQWDAGITPIVIDLNGDGIHTVSRENSSGSFDLLGNGNPIQSGWLSGNDGFLAVDHNGNGRIDGISELFGGNAKGAGFAMLASYDSNGDGVVNADDAGFADLRIWQDANGNHQTDAGELMTLTQAGVSSLNVSYDELPFMDANGNLHLERSSATLADGTSVDMTDVYFNVSAADAAAAGVELPSMADLMSDSSSLDGLLAGSTSPAAPASSAGNSGADFDTSVLDAMKQMAHLYDQAVVHA